MRVFSLNPAETERAGTVCVIRAKANNNNSHLLVILVRRTAERENGVNLASDETATP